MRGPLGPFGGLGPFTPPITTDPGIKGGPDLVPIITCGVNAQGRRFVAFSVRNQGSEPAPRLFWVQFFVSGRGFIGGRTPVRALRPGQQLLLESFADDILQGIQPLVAVAEADVTRVIPEDLNPGNNRTVSRCFAMPVIQPGMTSLPL